MGGTTCLVLQTTDREQADLIAAVPMDILVVVAHIPVVGEVAIVLASSPPVAASADIVETAIGTAVTARQSRKAISVLARISLAKTGRTATIPAISRFQMFTRS